MKHAVKLVKEAAESFTVGGYGVVWGGADLRGERFERDTDLWFDRLTESPMVLYQHGMDSGTGRSVLGAVVAKSVDDVGLWIEAQIDAAHEYADAVRELVKTGLLGWSSGAVAHLVEIARDGKILSWPVAEFSLTPTPCEPRTVGVAELAAIEAPAVKALVDTIKALPAGATPAAGPNGYDPPAGSYEALIHQIQRGASRVLLEPGEYDAWLYVVATFPDHAIVCVCEGYGEADYYQIEYAVGADGSLAFGEYRRVDRVYLPRPEPLPSDELPMALMAAHTLRSASALLERTKGLHERRASEHRSLSDAHRSRLAEAGARLSDVAAGLGALLAATPDPEPAAASAKAVVAVGSAYLRLLTLVEHTS